MFSFFERLTKPFPDAQVADQVSPPKDLFTFYRYYMRGYDLPLLVMIGLNTLISIMEVSLLGFMGRLVDWLGKHDRTTFLENEYWNLIGMGLILLVALPVLRILANLLSFQSIMGNLPMSVRWRTHRQLLGQSVSFYQDEFAGRVATKIMQTSISVRDTIIKLVEVMVYIGVYFISMLVILSTINFWLMLPMLVWLILYLFLQGYFLPKLRSISEAQADARSTMTGRIVDAYTNISTIKLFAHTEREANYAKDSMNGFLQTVYQQMRLVNKLIFTVEFANYLLIFSVGAIGIGLWLHESASTGAIAVAIAMTIRLSSMSHWLMFEVSGLFENIGTVTDGMNMLSLPSTVTDKKDAKSLLVEKGEIQFRCVNFSYSQPTPSQGEDCSKETITSIIKDLNLLIKPGERIGLVGRSGAGKSTLVNTLLRFYDLESGEILIDGQNIADVKQNSLREQIAMVTQDTSLLHRSVRENILYGRPNASEDELQLAIKQSRADEFINELTDPDGNRGLDAQVGERGVKLSGGQRQRIAIARVLLKNAPILILDEATSALDSEVEVAIQESLLGLMANKTVIAIAHRLSTISALDRLVVIDQGQIVEMGSHQDLLRKDGIYAKLWRHQTGGFLGEA